MVKLSVIIPVYNNEKHIEKCINSIIKQSFTNLEIIIVNDGSTDKSLSICQFFADKDSRIKIITQDNQGVSSARNKGLERATGDYIGFVDSDDYIHADMYEKMTRIACKNNADIVETGFYYIDEAGKVIRTKQLTDAQINGKDECTYHFLQGQNSTNHVCNKIYRRCVLKNIKFPEFKYSEDYYFNYFAHSKCERKVINTSLNYFYVNNINSATNETFNKSKMDIIKVGNLVLEATARQQPELKPLVFNFLLRNLRVLFLQTSQKNDSNYLKYKELILEEYSETYIRWKNEVNYTKGLNNKQIVSNILFKINPNFFKALYELRTSTSRKK